MIVIKSGFEMWQQCGDVAVLLLTFGFLILGRGHEYLEEGLLKKTNEEEGNEIDGVVEEAEKEESVGQDELEDLHLELGRRMLVEGGLQVTLLRRGVRCRRKVVNGDMVAIQYEGRLEGAEGDVFHATELSQPFVFMVSAQQLTEASLYHFDRQPIFFLLGGSW